MRPLNFRRSKLLRSALGPVVGLVLALPAAAQEAPQPVAAKPTIDLAVPKPQAPVTRRYRQHEGFYLRANLGIGSFDVGGDGDLSTGGMSLAYDLLLGFGPTPGLALGVGALGDLQLSGDWEVAGSSVGSGDLLGLTVGPFVDAYPNAKGGWHFGALAGLALHSYELGNDERSALGFGGAVWAGHDVWVGPEWSVGGQLRVDASRASEDDIAASRIGLSLAFSVVYN